jgi:hypothetical protein
MHDERTATPDGTAVRVALWRALHVQVDSPPHVLKDEIGLRLVAPEDDWRRRPDMDPHFTSLFRASIVARARFIEDLVVEQAGNGVRQYVILGAGLDTFAQRRLEVASGLRVFEVDQPGPQSWKRQRLIDLGFGVPEWLRLVPVDFEAGDAWWQRLAVAGFDAGEPAVAHPGARSRLQRRPARVGSDADPALFRWANGWSSPTEQCRGAAGGDDLAIDTHAPTHEAPDSTIRPMTCSRLQRRV